MYTRCPNCQQAFSVTAEILQQAAGRVRCGSCAHVFDALDGLSEGPPRAGAPADEQERSFRAALEELGGDANIRIEDTGVEWRVVEEETGTDVVEAEQREGRSDASALHWTIQDDPEEPQNDSVIPESDRRARQEPLELATPTASEERYDDNTPLPGLLLDDDEDDAPPIPEMPRRRAEDFIEPRSPEFDERQVDLTLGEPEDWTDLLEEVADGQDAEPQPSGTQTGADEQTDALHADDEDPTAEHPAFDAGALTLVEDTAANDRGQPELTGDIEQQSDAELRLVDEIGSKRDAELELADDAEGQSDKSLELAGDIDELIEEEPELIGCDADSADEDTAEGAGAPGGQSDEARPSDPDTGTGHRVALPTEEEMTIDRLIDQDLLRATGEHEDLAATSSATRSAAVPPHVETIVMEGELVRSSLQVDVTVPESGGETPPEQPEALKDTGIRWRNDAHANEDSRGPGRYSGIAAAAVLGLLLAGQLVHAWRETLATYGVFNDTVGAVYRGLGAPITPDWDVNAWQFRETSGSTDESDSALTISSRLTNRSQGALPYPLLHVTLTDRYEEVVGSDLLEPSQYLAIRSARGMVDPGEDFAATVTIAPLSAGSAGFKLNVCYPIEGGRVRCATGAFKRK